MHKSTEVWSPSNKTLTIIISNIKDVLEDNRNLPSIVKIYNELKVNNLNNQTDGEKLE